MTERPQIDEVTGVETTGHTWDGIRELNKPLPRWWLLTFYATIVWSIVYMVLYPAWPTLTGYTLGTLGFSQRAVLAAEIKDALLQQADIKERISKAPLAEVPKSPELLRYALSLGGSAFQSNCAPCHGRNAQGAAGYPNLNDDDWLWGGSLEDIQTTINFGVRSDHKQTRSSQMPRFGLDNLLTADQINDVAGFVLSLSHAPGDAAMVARGGAIFKEQCSTCHGQAGKGTQALGAPNLTDQIWLYGGSPEAVATSIKTGRGGVMPAWAGRLDAVTIKALAIYIHSLGGGQ